MGAAPSTDLADWMARFARPDRLWYAKRLSGNDTLATGAHQAGPYVPRDFLISLFPSLSRPGVRPELTTFGSFIHEVRSLTRSRSADRR